VVSVGIWTVGSHGHLPEVMSTNALALKYGSDLAYGYKDVGSGACLLPNGDAIEGRYSGIQENRAQRSCDSDPDCKGYVVSSGCRGAFLYENPTGTVKGGGKQPKDSYTWRNRPCMAKDLDMVYANKGYGKCITAGGKEPKHKFISDIYEVECRRRCSIDTKCLGFSAATMNFQGCYLWKEGSLRAGGSKHYWNVASCYSKEASGNPDEVKEPAPAPAPPASTPAPEASKPAPTGDDVKYKKLGRNKCTNADGTALKHHYYGGLNEKSLQDECNKDSACYGYSASRWGGGLLWLEGGLQKGGQSWGGCSCMVKET